MQKVLLTSVCRPLGVRYGDAPSVGYELLHEQVTRTQGIFSPRSHHIQFGLDYIAENLEAPATVLQYPSRAELIRELERGYDVVGVSFLMAVFHRMKEVVALIREFSPNSKIVLGGYGTAMPDEVLRPFCDEICREEGVAFMRKLLGEPPLAMPYRHPLIVNSLSLFGLHVSRTGVVFGGLGCQNGCDFCCTSHFFKRRHIKLLPTGADLHAVVARYRELDPALSIIILDEDFLLNRRRALEFRDCVVRDGRPPAIFAFASVKAISQYTVTEILEMGIDGLWIGYEGTRSGYAKQSGKPVDELFRELRAHGISVLASMIVGFPYQTSAIIDEELAGLLALRPSLTQYLIYGPSPGTPFAEKAAREHLLHDELEAEPERFYRKGTGFFAVVKHPTMAPAEIEAAQRHCFEEDFRRLGPAIFRVVESWLLGRQALAKSPSALLRAKAQRFAADLRGAYPVFLAGRLLGPTAAVRRWIGDLETRIHAELGAPTLAERAKSIVALAMALWSGAKQKLGVVRQPRVVRRVWRHADGRLPSRVWRRLDRAMRRGRDPGHRVAVEVGPDLAVWIRIEGRLLADAAHRLAAHLRRALERKGDQMVVLDLAGATHVEADSAGHFALTLATYRERVRVVAPKVGRLAAALLPFVFSRGSSIG
jgi:haloalkane dehalogenase